MKRNEPCWCGSGKKYKKCHWQRDKQAPVPMAKVLKDFHRVFGKHPCMAPGGHDVSCKGSIVRAHTVSKKSQLSLIAEDGHVCGIDNEWGTLKRTGGLLDVGRIGINNASVFTGFCGAHDDALFKRIDTEALGPDPEQCFLLTYRPLCRELYLKEAMVRGMDVARDLDRGKELTAQLEIQELATLMTLGASSAVHSLRKYKEVFDQELLTADFSHIRALIIDLDRVPDLMCTSGVTPEVGFDGRALQDLGDLERQFDYLGLSLLGRGGTSGVAVFSWHESSDGACVPLAESFTDLPGEYQPDALLRFVLEHSENVFIRPSWWDGLTGKQHEVLKERMRAGIPFSGRDELSLSDDGLRVAPWKLTAARGINLGGVVRGFG